MNRLYIGNLNFKTEEAGLKSYFETCGTVKDVQIIKDKVTKRSRGFAFVEMQNDEEAKQAMQQLNGTELDGRKLKIDFAKEKRQSENN